jgi:predicted nucleotidyltransferase
MNAAEVNRLIAVIEALVSGRDELRGMAICGSWARGNPRPDSDLDVLIIAQEPGSLRRDEEWVHALRFSDAGFRYIGHHSAQYGAVWSAHIKLEPEAELELTFADKNWASVQRIDPSTRHVVTDAFTIIVDKDGRLRNLCDACSGGSP